MFNDNNESVLSNKAALYSRIKVFLFLSLFHKVESYFFYSFYLFIPRCIAFSSTLSILLTQRRISSDYLPERNKEINEIQ